MNIITYPAQCSNLVKQTVIARYLAHRLLAKFGMRQPAKRPQPVIYRNKDHSLARQFVTFRKWLTAASYSQRSTMNPDNNRHIAGIFGEIDVERQTIFGRRRRRIKINTTRRYFWLHTGRAKSGSISYSLPAGCRHGRFPAQRTDCRGSIGYAAINGQTPFLYSLQHSLADLHCWPGRGCRVD